MYGYLNSNVVQRRRSAVVRTACRFVSSPIGVWIKADLLEMQSSRKHNAAFNNVRTRATMFLWLHCCAVRPETISLSARQHKKHHLIRFFFFLRYFQYVDVCFCMYICIYTRICLRFATTDLTMMRNARLIDGDDNDDNARRSECQGCFRQTALSLASPHKLSQTFAQTKPPSPNFIQSTSQSSSSSSHHQCAYACTDWPRSVR